MKLLDHVTCNLMLQLMESMYKFHYEIDPWTGLWYLEQGSRGV